MRKTPAAQATRLTPPEKPTSQGDARQFLSDQVSDDAKQIGSEASQDFRELPGEERGWWLRTNEGELGEGREKKSSGGDYRERRRQQRKGRGRERGKGGERGRELK